jgi:putative nucleotidyltransferase with HDIG domain
MSDLPVLQPEQLRVGLYVHLDLSWMEHPFTFSRFKIRNQAQLETLQRLGLTQLRYDPARSDCEPLPLAAAQQVLAVASNPPRPDPSPQEQQAMAEKQARAERLGRLRSRIAAVEQTFTRAADKLRQITRVMHSRPEEAAAQGDALVTDLLDSLLAEGDTQIHAMSQSLGEDVYFHSLNVAVLSLTLGKALKLRRDELHQLGMAALFHDIGHGELPGSLFGKREPLNRAEQALYETHVKIGVGIAQKVGLAKPALTAIAQHHERLDGSGYPNRLGGAEISLFGRILALTNAYDNQCNPPDVARAVTPHEALAQLFAKQRQALDERLLRLLIRTLGVYPPGTLVRLSDQRLGIVVSVNALHALRPQVLVYDPDIPQDAALILDLEAEPALQVLEGLRPAAVPGDVRAYLNPRQRVSYYVESRKTTPASAGR